MFLFAFFCEHSYFKLGFESWQLREYNVCIRNPYGFEFVRDKMQAFSRGLFEPRHAASVCSSREDCGIVEGRPFDVEYVVSASRGTEDIFGRLQEQFRSVWAL